MNELMVRLMWLMGQVTLLSLAAAGLYAVIARRRPGAGAGVALAGLGGLLVLTGLAAIPLPVWWSWTGLLRAEGDTFSAASAGNTKYLVGGAPANHDTDPADFGVPAVSSGESESAADGWSLANLRRLWNQFMPTIGAAARSNPHWGSCVISLLLAGMCFCVMQLFLGLCAIRRCQTKSRRLNDPALLALSATLQSEMGCRRPVEVREATDIGGPVTLGWRRPVVLLPPQWRQWGDDELRAVLAHEVAHVRRADYAAWLLARFSVALHFYHPLAHWLAGRLHLQQELAADALGATHAGGRQAYLRALARLALRQEEWICTGPARAFLPVRGTLMRRIAMLRTEEKGPGRSWPRPLAVLVLGFAVVCVSALRGPAQAGAKPQARNSEAKTTEAPVTQPPAKPATVNRPPFAYCLCSPDAAGFFAFRPSVFFGSDPRMKTVADEMDKTIAEAMKTIGGPASFPKVEEIEQLSGCIFLKVDLTRPKGQRSQLLGSLLTLRTTGEYDWRKILASIAKKVTEVPFEGHKYYKVAFSDFKSPVLYGIVADAASLRDGSVCFFQPDQRTLAIGGEQQFQDMIHDGPAAKPAWAVAAGWEHVERGVFAAAITNQEQRFSKLWLTSPPEEFPAEVNAAVARTTAMIFGIDYDSELRADLFAACAKQEDAATAANSLLRWISKGQSAIHEVLQNPHDNVDPEALWCRKFLEQTSVGIERGADDAKQPIVHAQGHTQVDIKELFGFLTGARLQAVEVKGK